MNIKDIEEKNKKLLEGIYGLRRQIKISENIIIGQQLEINDLQKKIEDLKCCGNCDHFLKDKPCDKLSADCMTHVCKNWNHNYG